MLSPSTKLIDLNLKKARYERAGVQSSWVFDPPESRLVVWEIRDGGYLQVADVADDEEWTATQPFRVTIRPSSLRA